MAGLDPAGLQRLRVAGYCSTSRCASASRPCMVRVETRQATANSAVSDRNAQSRFSPPAPGSVLSCTVSVRAARCRASSACSRAICGAAGDDLLDPPPAHRRIGALQPGSAGLVGVGAGGRVQVDVTVGQPPGGTVGGASGCQSRSQFRASVSASSSAIRACCSKLSSIPTITHPATDIADGGRSRPRTRSEPFGTRSYLPCR